MIKRKFYSLDHGSDGDNDDASASSSSSSSDGAEDEAASVASVASGSDIEEERDDASSSPSSENEDREEDDGDGDDMETGGAGNLKETSECSDEEDSKNDPKKSGLRKTEDGKEIRKERKAHKSMGLEQGRMSKEEHVVRLKGVLKCKICPKIVCLNEETMSAHLSSKRHARSLKQFKEGRLKLMMTSDGELEEEAETHAERYARTIAITQKQPNVKRKNTGRQRQRKRAKQKSLKGEKAT